MSAIEEANENNISAEGELSEITVENPVPINYVLLVDVMIVLLGVSGDGLCVTNCDLVCRGMSEAMFDWNSF